MSTSFKQAAANLSAALDSGLEQHAVAAQASYQDALKGEEGPEPDLVQPKRDLPAPEGDASEDADAAEPEA